MTTPVKTSGLAVVTTYRGNNYVVLVDDLTGIPQTGRMELDVLFANVASPVTITANAAVTGANNILSAPNISSANIVSTDTHTPVSSSDVVTKGKVWFDTNYLYVATANNTIKRVALTSF